MRSLVLAISAIVLFRSWARDQSTYRRESTTDSLRRQLQQLPDLDAALDGRRLQDLSAQEVFTLAKALPAAVRGRACLMLNCPNQQLLLLKVLLVRFIKE